MKPEYIPFTNDLIELAIREDIGDGDHSSLACIPPDERGRMKLLVKNGILPGRGACDMLVEDGRIAKIEPNLEDADAQVVDAQGRCVLPGMVDLHCHLRDPGLEYKEDIVSGTRAAAALPPSAAWPTPTPSTTTRS